MEVHIGELIEAKISEVGITKAEFGRRINTSRQNVNTILKKKSLDTELLKSISKVLNHDFFRYYLEENVPESKRSHSLQRSNSGHVSLLIQIPKENQYKLLYALFDGKVPDILNAE